MAVKPFLKFNKGVSIIEILIVIFIMGFAFASFSALVSFSLQASGIANQTSRANDLAQEAMEAIRDFRNQTSWDADGLGILTAGVSYKIQEAVPSAWELVLGEEDVGVFNRTIIFKNVSRDVIDNIESVYNPINDDPDTRKVEVVISWEERGRSHQVFLNTYFTNWDQ
ncbi:MAG: hypothetical protein ABH889_00995 [Candidatus Portnoybacteria bacterium]